MGNIEQTLMLIFLLILMIVIYAIYKETRKKIISINFAASILLFVVLAFIIGSWNFIPLLNAVLHPGGLGTANISNTLGFNIMWSINPLGFFIPPYYNGFLFYLERTNSLIYNVGDNAYIGIVVLVLIYFAIGSEGKKMLPWIACTIIFLWLSLGPLFGLYEIYHSIPVHQRDKRTDPVRHDDNIIPIDTCSLRRQRHCSNILKKLKNTQNRASAPCICYLS